MVRAYAHSQSSCIAGVGVYVRKPELRAGRLLSWTECLHQGTSNLVCFVLVSVHQSCMLLANQSMKKIPDMDRCGMLWGPVYLQLLSTELAFVSFLLAVGFSVRDCRHSF